MSERFLIWSCTRRKFLKIISSENGYKERIGLKFNSIWYINIISSNIYEFGKPSNDTSYYTQWDIQIQREPLKDISEGFQINVKVVSNIKVLVDKTLYFGTNSHKSNMLFLEITNMHSSSLDCILRFPETNTAESAIEEHTIISKFKDLASDLQTMLDKGLLSDVTLKCGSETLQAHKNILSARSPVFEAMFSNPMQENINDVVVVDDIDSAIFRAVINFMYCGQLRITSMSMACDLLYAGEKYQVKELKEGCVTYLISVLCQENAIRILEVADLYDSRLKSEVLNFVKENFDELKDTREWKELMSKNSVLALEVYSIAQ